MNITAHATEINVSLVKMGNSHFLRDFFVVRKLTLLIHFHCLTTWIPNCQGKKRLLLTQLLTRSLSLGFKQQLRLLNTLSEGPDSGSSQGCLYITLAIERSLKTWWVCNARSWPLSAVSTVQRSLRVDEDLSQTWVYVMPEDSARTLCSCIALQLARHQVIRAEGCWKLKY